MRGLSIAQSCFEVSEVVILSGNRCPYLAAGGSNVSDMVLPRTR